MIDALSKKDWNSAGKASHSSSAEESLRGRAAQGCVKLNLSRVSSQSFLTNAFLCGECRSVGKSAGRKKGIWNLEECSRFTQVQA